MLVIVIGQELKIMGLCLLFHTKHKNMEKRIHKFSRTLCRHVHKLDVYKKLRRSFKITQSFVDNVPTDTNQYEMRTIKQAGFDIKPTTQKLIGIELLKVTSDMINTIIH